MGPFGRCRNAGCRGGERARRLFGPAGRRTEGGHRDAAVFTGNAIAHARSGGAVGLSGRRRKADAKLIWPRRRPSGGGGGLGEHSGFWAPAAAVKTRDTGEIRGEHTGVLWASSAAVVWRGEGEPGHRTPPSSPRSASAHARDPRGGVLWAPPAAVGGTRWGAGADSYVNIYGGLAAFGGSRGLFRGSGGRKGRMGGLRMF